MSSILPSAHNHGKPNGGRWVGGQAQGPMIRAIRLAVMARAAQKQRRPNLERR